MTTIFVKPSDIHVGDRKRVINRGALDRLKKSIEDIGLHTPLSVRRTDQGVTPWLLVTGMHRLQACIELGKTEVEVREETGTEDDAKLWEIDENLCRAELSEIDRAEHLRDRKVIYERLHPQAKAAIGADLAAKRWADNAAGNLPVASFAADTAAKTGLDESTIRRSIRRAESIPAEVREEIKDTTIADSGVQLDALAKAKDTPELQAEAVKAVKSGKAKDVRDVLLTPKRQPSRSGKPKERTKTGEQESSEKSNKVVLLHQSVVTPPKSDVVVRPDANLDLCCFMLERIVNPSIIKEGDVERLHEIVLRTYNERIQTAFSDALDKLGISSNVKRYYP